MQNYEIFITPYAREQMAEIRDYISQTLSNPTAARNLLNEIRSQIVGLKQMPQRIKTVDEHLWSSRGVRKIIIKNFFVYFWIDEAESVVHVTAVAYARRDQSTVLGEMEKN